MLMAYFLFLRTVNKIQSYCGVVAISVYTPVSTSSSDTQTNRKSLSFLR